MCEKFTVKSRIRDYEVNFVDDFMPALAAQSERSFFLVDHKVAELYRTKLEPLLPRGRMVLIEANESNKTLAYSQAVIEDLIARGLQRDHCLVAVGGGVVQDLAGFVASILYRGIRWVFFPTTLVGQADSCLGGKSSINLGGYKNLLGTLYPPEKIFIASHFLETLSVDEIKSGIGEILHFYLVADSAKNRDLMAEYDSLLEDPIRLSDYVHESLEIKKKIIEIDEFDQKERRIFNYGHTFGHAIESVSAYQINHGQAVTLGMDIANFVSMKLGYLSGASYTEMHRVLAKNLPIFRLSHVTLLSFFQALSRDKKNRADRLGCILTRGPGQMFEAHVLMDDSFQGLLTEYFEIYDDLSLSSRR